MDLPQIRKLLCFIEDVHREQDRAVDPPARKVAVAAVMKNPHAGVYSENLDDLVSAGEALGAFLGERAVGLLGPQAQIKSYGKAAIVGANSEMEHAAALLHPRLGLTLRKAVGHGAAIIPSTKKRAGPGATIDVPLHSKDDEWDVKYFDAMTISIPDAPNADEIVVAVAIATGGRPLARIQSTAPQPKESAS